MTRDDLSYPDDPASVLAFAASLNGYDYHGSLHACAAAAREKRRETIEDLRNELFWYCRALNHAGMDSAKLARFHRDELLAHFLRLLG